MFAMNYYMIGLIGSNNRWSLGDRGVTFPNVLIPVFTAFSDTVFLLSVVNVSLEYQVDVKLI